MKTKQELDLPREKIPKSPPSIQPVSSEGPRPLWSVMVPVFNCSGFLRETLESVLWQDLGESHMQIEVVDDCSTDADVEAIVLAMGKGRIGYFRQPKNVGSLWNFKTCIDKANGKLVHILHGDDKVRPGFYTHMSNLFNSYPSIGAGFCRFAYINEQSEFLFNQPKEMGHAGILNNTIERLCERQKIQYASMVVRREVYESLGSFYGVEYGEDWEMWVRIAVQYPIGYNPEVLAEYRRHSNSISGQSFLTARNMECLEWVMGIIEKHLPPGKKAPVMLRCRKFYSHYALRVAKSIWVDYRNKVAVELQIAAALRLHSNIMLTFQIILLRARMFVGL